MALSTTKAEYIAASFAAYQIIWLKSVLESIKFKQEGPATLFCDNSSTISVSKDPVLHGRTKHIRIQFHFFRELVNEREINIEFCISEEQLAYVFTKALGGHIFTRNVAALGVKSKFGLGETLLKS